MESQKRVAVYARVSTDDQTIESQLDACRKFCESKGWAMKPEDTFIDDGVQGNVVSREALDRLWVLLRKRRYDALVLWKYDRMARDVVQQIMTLDEIKSLGMDYISIADHIDTTTPMGRFQYTINAGYAEMQRTATKQNCRIGIDYALKHGVKFGRAGWKTRRGTITEEQRQQILSLAGTRSIRDIARSVPGVSKSTVHNVLSSKPDQNVALFPDEQAVGF